MYKKLLKACSMLLVIVMVINMLPMSIFAAEYRKTQTADASIPDGNSVSTQEFDQPLTDAQLQETLTTARIVEEVPGRRTEYTKEYKLNNGLYMAAVYPEAVHYNEDGQWKEIDNTLKVNANGTLTNTAGVWEVSFPQQLTGAKSISITKDGYTLSFAMAGELRSLSLSTMQMNTGEPEETLTVASMQTSTAQVQSVEPIVISSYQETSLTKLQSRLAYNSVYPNTNVIYDLRSNKVKESVVLEAYNSALRGYRYTLHVGELLPVLDDSGQIHFFAQDKETEVMVMPAPYLLDANNVFNGDVQVQLTGSGSTYTLTYLLPQQWLSGEERAWPVVLDPVVQATISAKNIQDRRIAENTSWSYDHPILETGYDKNYGRTRSYLKFINLPPLTSSDVVVDATLSLYQPSTRPDPNMQFCVDVHKVTGTWDSTTITWATQPTYDSNIAEYCIVGGTPGYYTWNITDMVRSWYSVGNQGMMLKSTAANEAAAVDSWMQFYASDYGYNMPVLTIFYRNNNGLESYWDYTSSSAGRAGTGYVNNFTGNLVWVRDDIGFGGNRMPVTVTHIYNAADAAKNNFGMGYGWRSNFHQRVYQMPNSTDTYVWEDADGTDHYFYSDGAGAYKDEDGLQLTLTVNSSSTDARYVISDKYGNKSQFDSVGRLRKQINNQATTSAITITYTTTDGYLISKITDGVGRVYDFTHTNDLLTRISYKGLGTTELSYVTFGYSSTNLTSVTDKDGKTCQYTYQTGHLLTKAQDIDGYRLTYTYSSQPYRVIKIAESDGTAQGGVTNIAYGNNQTTFTDHNGNMQTVQFNSYGNTVVVMDDEGNAAFAQYATDLVGDTARNNQLQLSSKLQNTVGNMLKNTGFETNTDGWSVNNASAVLSCTTETAYYGNSSMKAACSQSASHILGPTFIAEAGKTYTFSAYVKTVGMGVTICVTNTATGETTLGETLPAGEEWTRIQVSYTNSTNAAITLRTGFTGSGNGTYYVDCVQAEKAPIASRYNLIENGDFRYTGSPAHGWTGTGLASGDGIIYGDEQTDAAAAQLSKDFFRITGSPMASKRLSQTVNVSGTAGDTFVLSGWAMANAAPEGPDRIFGISATFIYADNSGEPFTVFFNPGVGGWQYAAMPVVAEKNYTGVVVSLIYDYNINTVWFDGIQLYKETFGNSYTYDTSGNVISIVDLQKQETTYAYVDNKLTAEILPTGKVLTYEYDQWFNVIEATDGDGLTYTFTYDYYGNNTMVSVSNGIETITTRAEYSNSGNTLFKTVDALGKETEYCYNANTNVLEWVKYPEDTAATRTNYTYDSMYRLATTTVTTDNNHTLSASYTYTDDLLTQLSTESTAYTFSYGDFSLRTSVAIGSRTLASYFYTDDLNRDLSRLVYGNQDQVQYTYDKKGRVIKEEFEDGATVTYQYDNDGALATVTDSETGICITYYYDFTDRTMKYVEKGLNYYHSVGYEYNVHNNLTAMVETINGVEHTTSYTYNSEHLPLTTENGASKKTNVYDGFDRVSETVITHNGTQVFRNEIWYSGTTQSNTSNRPDSYFTYLNNKMFFEVYTFDGNGNIVFVESSGGYIFYTYDSANQLIREDNENIDKTFVWTYDEAGNILSRYEYPYTYVMDDPVSPTKIVQYDYDDDNWRDLLTSYDGRSFSYDAIGNLTNDGVWSYTWKHGRELASMTKGSTTWTYTYNANGLRIKRTNGTTTYTYVYNEGLLTQMTVGSNTLYITYDNGGLPFAVTCNGTVYYYVLSLQGDVVGIADSTGTLVVEYAYDAWGRLHRLTGSMASTLGTWNPMRYRSYVYDTETGLYYLQSRYYNPEIGRFINADGLVSTGQGPLGNNMFAYCGNNPVNFYDPHGNYFTEVLATVTDNLIRLASVVTTAVELHLMGFYNLSFDMVVACVDTLKLYGINTPEEKAHFFAQCAAETNCGLWLTELGSQAYFAQKEYGYKYRGAGYIQLTWDYNYYNFAIAMGDSEIYNQGADYVAANYAWQAAGWFWNNNCINAKIAQGYTVEKVTRIVKGSSAGWQSRQEYYDRFIQILS